MISLPSNYLDRLVNRSAQMQVNQAAKPFLLDKIKSIPTMRSGRRSNPAKRKSR